MKNFTNSIAGILIFAVISMSACTNGGTQSNSPASKAEEPALAPAPAQVEAVDLGLPSGTKWANMNVGAKKPEDYGIYFAWAETRGYPAGTQRKFDVPSYKWFDAAKGTYTKYCADGGFGNVDNIKFLPLEDDAAHANWGGSWRLPQFDEILELVDNTTHEWTTLNGVEGCKLTSKSNGNSVFFPATGCYGPNGIGSQGEYGYYWSLSLYPSDAGCARGFFFTKELARTSGSMRHIGRTVRPVCK